MGQSRRIECPHWFWLLLNECYIGEYSVIKPYTVAESATIGREAQIGPFTRLRPGTELSDKTHVGNFCEIKMRV